MGQQGFKSPKTPVN